MRVANMLGHVTTPAAHVITITITAAAGATMALVTRTTAIIRVIRTRTGVTAYPEAITRTRIMAAIRPVGTTTTTRTMAAIPTVVITVTRTTHRLTAIMAQRLQLCSNVLADSVITTA